MGFIRPYQVISVRRQRRCNVITYAKGCHRTALRKYRPRCRHGQGKEKIGIRLRHDKKTKTSDAFRFMYVVSSLFDSDQQTDIVHRALPPEIRNMIYAFLLTAQSPLLLIPLFRSGTNQPIIFRMFSDDDDIWTCRPERPCINMLRVCKSVHAEASAILYHSNKFVFGGADGVLQWLRTLRKPSRRSLRSVEVWNYCFVHGNRRNRSWLRKKMKKLAPKAEVVIGLSRLDLWSAR